MRLKAILRLLRNSVLLGILACLTAAPAHATVSGPLANINNIVVIYLENWSFDALFGTYPGANGRSNAGASATQIDLSGTAWGSPNNLTYSVGSASLPSFNPQLGMPVLEKNVCGNTSYCYVPNAPWDLSQYLAPTGITSTDLPHKYYTEQLQIDGGLMDRFTDWDNTSLGLSMSYYDSTYMPTGLLAQQYTICDTFFHGSFGGSFMNHLWLVAGQPIPVPQSGGEWVVSDLANGPGVLGNYVSVTNTATGYISPPVPAGVTNSVDSNLTRSAPFFWVNTSYPVNPPTITNSLSGYATAPCCYMPGITGTANIGDFLSGQATPVSWKWYSGGWDEANGNTTEANADLFQFHHQPFNYWAEFAPGTLSRTAHLADEIQFYNDLNADTLSASAPAGLPAVSFIKPIGSDNEHPNYSSLMQGQQHVAQLVSAIQNSPYWAHTLIIITYDEHGGRWDHVAPPGSAQGMIPSVQAYYQANTLTADAWGPGSRVPAILVSPYVRTGYVDHTVYETSSILKLIQDRWPSSTAPGGPYLSPRVAAVNSLELSLTQDAQKPLPTPGTGALQKTAFGPVPAHRGTPVCVFYEKPVNSSHWDIYNLAGEKAASLDFGNDAQACWDSSAAAPGIYMIRSALSFQDGTTKTVWNKVIVQP